LPASRDKKENDGDEDRGKRKGNQKGNGDLGGGADEDILALVTVKPGSEGRAIEEIEDLFARFNVPARAAQSPVGGNVIIRGTAAKGLLAAVLGRLQSASVQRVVIFTAVTSSDLKEIATACSSALKQLMSKKQVSTFRVKAKCRATALSEHEVEVEVGRRLKEECGIPVDLSNPSVTVYVEVLGDLAGVALGRYA